MSDDSKNDSWFIRIIGFFIDMGILELCLMLAGTIFAPLIVFISLFLSGGATAALEIQLGHEHWFSAIYGSFFAFVCAIVLLVGAELYKQGLLKHVLDRVLQLTDEGWLILSWRCGLYCLFLALVNGFVRYSFPWKFAENFEIFGMWFLIGVFALSQIPLVDKYKLPKQADE